MNRFPSSLRSPLDWWYALRGRKVAYGTIVVMLVVLAFVTAIALRNVLVIAFLGILIATALRPVVSRISSNTPLPRFLAASAAILLLVGLLIGFVVLIVPMFVEQANTVLREIPGFYADVRSAFTDSRYRIVREFGYRLQPQIVTEGDTLSATLMSSGLVWLPAIGYSLFVGLSTILFSYYWLLYRERSLRGLLLLLPIDQRDGAERVWLEIELRIGAFVRGQALLALITGSLSLVGYWLVGAPYALLLGLIAGLLELVPFIGPTITAAIATAAGFSVSPTIGLSALAVGIVVQQLENTLLAPRIMDRAVGVSPVLTLLAFVGFAALFGIAGGLLAIPLAAVSQVLFNVWLSASVAADTDESLHGRDVVERLRYRVRELGQDLAAVMRRKEAEVTMESDVYEERLEVLLSDLNALLEQTKREAA